MATKSQANAAATEADAQSDASATAQDDPKAPAASPPPAVAAPPGREPGGVFEYVDGTPSTTLFDGFPPQSAEYGDVCDLPYDPGLPRWQRSTRAVNRQPDNHPDEARKTSLVQAALRAEIHAAVATPTANDTAKGA